MVRPAVYNGAAVLADVRAGHKTAAVAAHHGCTAMRVRQLCREHGVTPPGQDTLAANAGLASRPPMPWLMLVQLMCALVFNKGHSYGARQLYDDLAWDHWQFHISRRAVRLACIALWPLQFAARKNNAMRRLLRGYFYAPYVGYSMYIDANCKLQEYGLYVSGAQDGKSRRILSLTCLTDLLMLTVYHNTWVPAVATLGFLPDQTLTDKGSENLLLAFVCHHLHMVFILANGLAQQAGHRARHRFVPSTRNRIERFWAEVNLRVNLPVKLMLVHMENILNILDIGNVHHIGAVQTLLKPIIQHGLDMLKDTYNKHYVRSSRRHGGRPLILWQQYPHPGGNPTLPPGYDAVAEYERANPGKTVTRRPAWVATRDPISNDQAKRLARHQAIVNIWGPDVTRVYPDILHNRGLTYFVPAFLEFLRHT